MIIMHFALKNEWDSESKLGTYGTSCIDRDGFIPCFKISDISNINITLSTLKDYIILCIDDTKINSEIKFEKRNDTNFEEPNIYGKIPSDAVISILPYTFDNDDKFVPTENLLDFNTINEVCEKLNINYNSHKYFHDGTTSKIILLNNEYIIKIANTEQLKAEVKFATFYESVPTLQKIAYYDKEFSYVVYNFIPGDVMHTVSDFEDLARSTKFIVSSYKNYTDDSFGYIENPTSSWTNFLNQEVDDVSSYFPESQNLLPVVKDAINELNKYPFTKKLIHGDFGTHNFIKRNEKFISAIDPMPIAGDPTYDLLSALVSNIDLIPFLSINYLTEYTKEQKPKLIAILKVVLFIRICRCAKYNKEDLETYLDFWYNLFN